MVWDEVAEPVDNLPELVGVREIAERTGLSYEAVRSRKARGELPDPDYVLATGPIWRAEIIDDWRASVKS
jgi:hypothetical protein